MNRNKVEHVSFVSLSCLRNNLSHHFPSPTNFKQCGLNADSLVLPNLHFWLQKKLQPDREAEKIISNSFRNTGAKRKELPSLIWMIEALFGRFIILPTAWLVLCFYISSSGSTVFSERVLTGRFLVVAYYTSFICLEITQKQFFQFNVLPKNTTYFNRNLKLILIQYADNTEERLLNL